MTTVPAETLETLEVREHTRRTASDVASCFHLVTGSNGTAVGDARSSPCGPAGLEGRDVTDYRAAQGIALAATRGGEQ